MTNFVRPRTSRGAWIVACLAAALAAGCDRRNLAWSYAPEGPQRLAAARSAALVQEPDSPGGRLPELVSALAGELMRKGWSITLLREAWPPPAIYRGPVVYAPAPPTAAAIPLLPGDLLARYAAAREVRAELLLELSVETSTDAQVFMVSGPFVHHRVIVREKRYIRQATLRISSPREQRLLAAVSVEYDDPAGSIAAVARDLCLGLDFVRQAWPPQSVTLKGPTGDVRIIAPVPAPPSRRDEPTSQP
jgi:hypothetical protein